MKSRYIIISLLAVSTLLAAVPCNAQVAADKKVKVFLGYSNLQAEGLQNTNTPPGIFDTEFFRDRTTLHGGNFELTGTYKGVGLTGDVSFNRDGRTTEFTGGHSTINTDITYYMGGPQFSYAGMRRVEPFFRVLAGGAYTKHEVSATVNLPPGGPAATATTSFESSSNSFAMGVGGGLDVRLGDGPVRLRIIQVDYTPIFFSDKAISVLGPSGAVQPFNLEGQRADNVRFAFGFVF